MRPGKQLFPLNYNNIINNNNIKNNIQAIKLIIKETYGGNRTYINQIMFYEESAEKVQEIMSGNELSKIYKNHKKLVKSYTNVQLPYNNNKINRNNRSLSKGKISKTITEDLSKYKTQYISQNKKNIKNLKRASKKQFAEHDENENENELNEDNEDENDIYNEEGKIINIEEEGYNNGKSQEYFKEEENNENDNENKEEIKNNYNNNGNENKNYYYKINNQNKNNSSNNINQINNRKNKQKKKSYELANINKTNISIKTDITDIQKNKNRKKQQLEIKLNDNLTPNKYLKRVQSYSNKNNTINSNLNLSLSKNFGYVLNGKETEKNISNIDTSNVSYNKNNFKSKIPSSTTYNYYVNQSANDNQEEENNYTNEQINMNDKYQTYGERMSEPINYTKIEYPPSSFNRTNALIRNNLNNDNNNNMDIDEQNQLIDRVNDKNNTNSYITNKNGRMNQTYGEINFRNRSKYNINNENKENYPSVITNRNSNNSNLYDEQNENNIYGNNNSIGTYQNSKNISGIQQDKNIIMTNNNTTNNSQRYSIITNYENYKSNNNSNNKKQIKQKLDYLEGSIIEIKKEIGLISENLSFLSSKEFIFNNFKEYVVQICEEIYNEYLINNFNNKDKNNSFISNNSNYDNNNQISHNNNLNNNNNGEILLENEINKKIDEKLGNLKSNLFDKFLQPKINEIGESMKKNIEQLKSKVDTIGNNINIYKDKNIYEKTNSNSNEESLIYKSSSKLRNEKFDEINRIGEKLYNKLLEKERKLKLLKQEKTKFLNEEIEKDN